jgi:hypothetical protein
MLGLPWGTIERLFGSVTDAQFVVEGKTVKKDKMRRLVATVAAVALTSAAAAIGLLTTSDDAQAGPLSRWWHRDGCGKGGVCGVEEPPIDDVGGTWYWLRSPDEEKRVVAGLYNRYCIRCHGVDGRGVWDMPDIPNFANARWQACRSDGQIARIILEGRGAVMPPFRGTLTLEESWAMARYLRTFVPGTEVMRPDLGANEGGRPGAGSKAP